MKYDRTGKRVGQLGLAAYRGLLTLHWEARTTHDGPLRTVLWDQRQDQYSVLDESGQKLGWTISQPRTGLEIMLADGSLLPDFSIQRGWFRRYKRILLGHDTLRPVLMLEGQIRVFGNDLIRIEHRDFKSEITYICRPEMEVGALILSFLLFNTPNCQGQG